MPFACAIPTHSLMTRLAITIAAALRRKIPLSIFSKGHTELNTLLTIAFFQMIASTATSALKGNKLVFNASTTSFNFEATGLTLPIGETATGL